MHFLAHWLITVGGTVASAVLGFEYLAAAILFVGFMISPDCESK